MPKLISITKETYQELYYLITCKREELLRSGEARSITYDDMIRELIKEYKKVN